MNLLIIENGSVGGLLHPGPLQLLVDPGENGRCDGNYEDSANQGCYYDTYRIDVNRESF